MFIIERGKVDITKKGHNDGKPLEQLSGGAIFGQTALISHEPRSASITAVTEVVALRMSKEAYDLVLSKMGGQSKIQWELNAKEHEARRAKQEIERHLASR